jgi:hypothetical protein
MIRIKEDFQRMIIAASDSANKEGPVLILFPTEKAAKDAITRTAKVVLRLIVKMPQIPSVREAGGKGTSPKGRRNEDETKERTWWTTKKKRIAVAFR